ncbi:hypothetical protein F5Y05DRAFT_89143 [Hypoxylon sp. FL0543]|nr:hypothetical protein F5Y05DRAFT_89143 [Hypoxylon sp. FL0543]
MHFRPQGSVKYSSSECVGLSALLVRFSEFRNIYNNKNPLIRRVTLTISHPLRSLARTEAATTTTMTYRAENATGFNVHTMIHSKYVPNSKGLSIILIEELGKGGFEVEVCIPDGIASDEPMLIGW